MILFRITSFFLQYGCRSKLFITYIITDIQLTKLQLEQALTETNKFLEQAQTNAVKKALTDLKQNLEHRLEQVSSLFMYKNIAG